MSTLMGRKPIRKAEIRIRVLEGGAMRWTTVEERTETRDILGFNVIGGSRSEALAIGDRRGYSIERGPGVGEGSMRGKASICFRGNTEHNVPVAIWFEEI